MVTQKAIVGGDTSAALNCAAMRVRNPLVP